MVKSIADRLTYAFEILEVDPSDRILEIGCGYGAAASLICGRLVDGKITAIDQSEKMIRAAEKLNAPFVSAGKAIFLAAPLHEADLGHSRFNKIFAVNVNLFWMKAARELERIRELLLPGGTIYLFNQPPSAGKLRSIAERTGQNLADAGFTVKQIMIGDQKPIPVVCVIAVGGQDHTA